MLRFTHVSGGIKALSVSAALLVGSAAVAATIPADVIPDTHNVARGGVVTSLGSTSGTLSRLTDGQTRSYSRLSGLLATGARLDDLDLSSLSGFIGGAYQPKSASDPGVILGSSRRDTHADGSITSWISVWAGTYSKAVKIRLYEDDLSGNVYYQVEAAGYTSDQNDLGKNFDDITYNRQSIATNAGVDGYGLAELSVRAKDGRFFDVNPAYGEGTHVLTNRGAADALFVDFVQSSGDAADNYVEQVNLWQATDCCQSNLGPIIVDLYDANDQLVTSLTVQQSEFVSDTTSRQSYATVRFASVAARRAEIRSASPTNQLALTEFQAFATPAPAVLGLMGLGLAGVAFAARRRRKG